MCYTCVSLSLHLQYKVCSPSLLCQTLFTPVGICISPGFDVLFSCSLSEFVLDNLIPLLDFIWSSTFQRAAWNERCWTFWLCPNCGSILVRSLIYVRFNHHKTLRDMSPLTGRLNYILPGLPGRYSLPYMVVGSHLVWSLYSLLGTNLMSGVWWKRTVVYACDDPRRKEDTASSSLLFFFHSCLELLSLSPPVII